VLSITEDPSSARKPSLVQDNLLPCINTIRPLQKRYAFVETLNCLLARLLMRPMATWEILVENHWSLGKEWVKSW
jgi:hypothetical protein